MRKVEINSDDVIIHKGIEFHKKTINYTPSCTELIFTRQFPRKEYKVPSFEIRCKSEIERESLEIFNYLDRMTKVRVPDMIDAMIYSQMASIDRRIKGTWKVNETKSKTRYLSFTYEGRQITLCGKNTGNKIEVGYSVYCDNAIDKRKSKTPKDEELSKKIALGRLNKTPFFSIIVSKEPHRFIDTALDVVRTKILKSELIIKGIR